MTLYSEQPQQPQGHIPTANMVGAQNANQLRDREEKHVNLRGEIELLADSIGNLACLRDRILGGDRPKEVATSAPLAPMHSLLEVLENGPRQIAETRAIMCQLVEEINQSLF